MKTDETKLRSLLKETSFHLAALIEHASPDAPPEIVRYQRALLMQINDALGSTKATVTP